MNKIEEKRLIINDIDQKMVELFEKRMEAVKEIALYKKENKLPIFDEEREKALIEKNLSYLKNQELKEYYLEFEKALLKESKEYQKKLL